MSAGRESGPVAEDLLVRARRNDLSEAERRRLRALLKASKELELLYLAGVELDRSSALVASDEARMRRLVELGRAQASAARRESVGHGDARAARGFGGRRGSAPARTTASALALGAVLGAAVSAAFQYGSERSFRDAPAAPAGSVAVPPLGRASRGPARPVPVVSAPAPSAAFPPVMPDSAARRSTDAPKRATGDDAAALFTKASEARRKGDSEAAIRLYELLCARFPDSVEAADARVTLGKLKLQHRAAAEALRLFETYPSGTLSAEALWGQAEALKQMSSPAERATLERIVREYPDSSYAMAARKRLEARR